MKINDKLFQLNKLIQEIKNISEKLGNDNAFESKVNELNKEVSALKKGIEEWRNKWWITPINYFGCHKCYPVRLDKESGNVTALRSRSVKKSEELSKLKRRRYRIEAGIDRKELNDSIYASSNDDVQVQEIHLVKDQPYTFIFRSRDVIHCPWFPHFRAQINAVPGMETNFKLTPTITTVEMRAKPDVIEHWKNINVIHNERKRRIGEQEEEVIIENIEEPKVEEKAETKIEEPKPEIKMEKEEDITPPIVPSIVNKDESPVLTKLTFNDMDAMQDIDGIVENIEAPKTIERLEEISNARALERKLEEEAEDENDRIQIHTDNLSLGDLDILDIEKNNNGLGDQLLLEDIEVLE